eukprot:TRINITY_DN49_c0_g2_i1.p1 TRINITY_DN49_c0_g2~~TRINITY_DN49_c0_g2_i1.p1  ORF type:complete len:467 (-),score=136.25 TRINITY_DN49_c0_g2_i1:32-1360(-)
MSRERVLPKIQISNLPEDITAKDLRDLCSPFGAVREAQFDPTRCEGTVNFAKSEDAAAAIYKLDRKLYYGGAIKVSWARIPVEEKPQPQKGKQGEDKDAKGKNPKNPKNPATVPSGSKDSGKTASGSGANVSTGTTQPKVSAPTSSILSQPREVVGAPTTLHSNDASAKSNASNAKQNPNPSTKKPQPAPAKQKNTKNKNNNNQTKVKSAPSQESDESTPSTNNIEPSAPTPKQPGPNVTENRKQNSNPSAPKQNANQSTNKQNPKTAKNAKTTSPGNSKWVPKTGAANSTSTGTSEHAEESHPAAKGSVPSDHRATPGDVQGQSDVFLSQPPPPSTIDLGYSFFTNSPPFPEPASNSGTAYGFVDTDQQQQNEPPRGEQNFHFELVIRNLVTKEESLVATLDSNRINISHPHLIKHFIWPVLGEYVLNYNNPPSQSKQFHE